ncbi:MAG: hypothetical protein M3Q88_02620 [Pseudomonadota bacterium]|nr:hypothetical protein [Pseudomonadota bacterium]
MSAHGFKSVFMVGAIASAALGCYLVSLRVASERAALENVENKIVLAQRDIRLINTEIGTRGRLAQLERWNVKVIRLSAPSADQFVESSFQLATLVKPDTTPSIEAPLVYASAPAPVRRDPVVTNDDGSEIQPSRAPRALGDMMHVASYAKPEPKPTRAARTDTARPLASSAKSRSPTAVKPVKTATADPLGPLPGAGSKAKSDGGAGDARIITTTTKDPGSRQ